MSAEETMRSVFSEAGLVDELQLAITPIVLGAGRALFEGVTTRPAFERTQCRAFDNGSVFLRYERPRAK